MAAKRKDRIFGTHTATIIADHYPRASAPLDLDAHGAGARVQRVLDQFLKSRGRTLDHLTRRYLARDVLRQDMNDSVAHPYTCRCFPMVSMNQFVALLNSSVRRGQPLKSAFSRRAPGGSSFVRPFNCVMHPASLVI
jgi:hypothetical protein